MNALSPRAVVLFAHGSRDPLWHKPIEAVAAQLASGTPGLAVRCAYLELSRPDLATACQQLVDAGIQDISVLPLFLGVGLASAHQLGVPGETLAGVQDAVDFIATLRQAADKSTVRVGQRVVVIGGGMTAVDAAVQSKLLGAESVTLVMTGADSVKSVLTCCKVTAPPTPALFATCAV